ncbi:uncharacterized protein LOC111866019 [Cryptotermes secundus]|uniref:uncharacterized protein LOC111866019 n=1 Tax=Cryptotermes secundus TaxID=105785 RepID=UPI001454DF21|nr:uncharacterized protein LOC111866019 [Cryptotermes secundus]
MKNRSINFNKASGLNKAADNANVIELVTLKFVGKNPSSGTVLDVWIADEQNVGFLACADLFPDKMRNLEGREIRVTTINYLPYVVLIHDNETPVYDGVEFLVFMEFANKINASWKLVLDEDNFWGTAWPNGSGNGILGNIAEDRADVGFAALYSWHSTFLWTDYTVSCLTAGVTCLVPKPKMLPTWMSLWLPFSPAMWTAIVVSIVVITLALYMLAKASSRHFGTFTLESYATWINCFLTTLGMFVLQPPVDAEAAGYGPMRVFVTSLLVFFLLVSTVYSGGLASILTVPRYEHPIDTVKDLADSNLPWVNVHEAWVWSLLDSEDPVSKTLVQHFHVLTEEEMTALSTQGKTAFSLEKLAGDHYSVPIHINETAVHTLRIMNEMLYGGHVVTIIRKSSPYKEYFNQIISSLYETGIVHYWEGQTIQRYMSQRLQIAIKQSVVLDTQDGPIQLTLIEVENLRELFTNHELHLNGKGKESLANKIVKATKDIYVKGSTPIERKWKEEIMGSSDEDDDLVDDQNAPNQEAQDGDGHVNEEQVTEILKCDKQIETQVK